jgi:hypothetical protein
MLAIQKGILSRMRAARGAQPNNRRALAPFGNATHPGSSNRVQADEKTEDNAPDNEAGGHDIEPPRDVRRGHPRRNEQGQDDTGQHELPCKIRDKMRHAVARYRPRWRAALVFLDPCDPMPATPAKA